MRVVERITLQLDEDRVACMVGYRRKDVRAVIHHPCILETVFGLRRNVAARVAVAANVEFHE